MIGWQRRGMEALLLEPKHMLFTYSLIGSAEMRPPVAARPEVRGRTKAGLARAQTLCCRHKTFGFARRIWLRHRFASQRRGHGYAVPVDGHGCREHVVPAVAMWTKEDAFWSW